MKEEKTIFFDLDETLIHACGIAENPQFIFPALTEDNEGGLVLIIKKYRKIHFIYIYIIIYNKKLYLFYYS